MKGSIFFAILCSISLVGLSQTYDIDSSFGVNGTMKIVSPDTLSLSNYVYALKNEHAIASPHDVFTNWQDQVLLPGAIYFTLDGKQIDSTKHLNGIARTNFGPHNLNTTNANFTTCISFLSDNRLLIGGRKKGNALPFNYEGSLICFLPNGKIDSSFGLNGIFIYPFLNDWAKFDLIHQVNANRILLSSVNDDFEQNTIVAIKSNGIIDSSYGINGITNYSALLKTVGKSKLYKKPAFYPDGSAVIMTLVMDSVSWSLNRTEWVKLKSNGLIDSSFGINGIHEIIYPSSTHFFSQNNMLSQNVVGPDGGLYSQIRKTGLDNYDLLKCLPNGTVDSIFGFNGLYSMPLVPSNSNYNYQRLNYFKVLENNKIVLVGDARDTILTSKWDGVVSIIKPNGQIDSSFESNGYQFIDNRINASDGYSQVLSSDSNSFYTCGSAYNSNLYYNQHYLITKYIRKGIPLQISSAQKQVEFSLYPNPVSDKVYIISSKDKFKLTVYSMQGMALYSSHYYSSNISLSTYNYPTGIYCVELEYYDGSRATRLMLKQ